MKRCFVRLTRPTLMTVAAVLLLTPGARSQQDDTGDREAVLATVQEFFRTMTAKDTEGARAVLEPEGRFFSVRPAPDGTRSVGSFTNQSYLDGLASGTTHQVERLWDPEVRIHDGVANVWAPYDFHIDGKFSHCGVDSFDLIRTDTGWKISGGVYTVQPEGCAPSPLGPLARD